jgi:cytochrome P450
MSTTTIPEFSEDMFTDDSIRYPYEQYRRIRNLGPVVHYAPADCYVVARYDDVRRVLRDARTFISGKGVAMSDEANAALSTGVLTSDGAEHDFLRKIEGEPFGADAVKELVAQVELEAQGLMDRIMAGPKHIDAMPALAQYLPLKIVTELVGLPEEGRENMLSWAAAGFDIIGPFNDRAKTSFGIMGEWVGYTLGLQQAVVKPGSWAWRAFRLAQEGTIGPDMVPRLLMSLIGPSLDTTILGTGNLLMLLGQNPDQWRILKATPSLVPNAVNEALRLESPIRCFTRYAITEAEVDGVTIPQGSRILVLYGSANRDERRWENAEKFDVTRPNAAAHLAFGAGEHTCLGAHLARLEMHALTKSLLANVEDMEIGEPVFALNNTLRGLDSLPMTLN